MRERSGGVIGPTWRHPLEGANRHKKSVQLVRTEALEPRARIAAGAVPRDPQNCRLFFPTNQSQAALSHICRAALLFAGLYSYPVSAEPGPGFTYCVAPYPPDCVKKPLNSESHDDCETSVQAYVASVFRFRECIEAESEREVRRANEVLEQWRCKVSRMECRR